MIYLFILTITGIAAYFDARDKKIPNELIIIGLISSLFFMGSLEIFLWRALFILLLFFFGMFHLLGMGDLKLWMVLCAYTGFLESAYIIGGAAFLLICYGLITNSRESSFILKYMGFHFISKQKIQRLEQKSYAFAPFVFAASCVYTVLKVLVL